MNELPLLRVLRGEPTAEELAAVVTVLVGRAGPAGFAGPAVAPGRSAVGVSRWRMSTRPVPPGAVRPGPGAWRASALP